MIDHPQAERQTPLRLDPVQAGDALDHRVELGEAIESDLVVQEQAWSSAD